MRELGWVCSSNLGPGRGQEQAGGIQMGSRPSLTGCHRTRADLPATSLFLTVRMLLKYFTAPESYARLFSPKHGSIFIPLVHNAWSSTLSLFRSTGCSQDIFLTVFLSFNSNISLPLPLPLPNHPEIYSLVDIDFLLSSILPSGFLFFPPLSSANCIVFIFCYAGNLIMKERFFFFLFFN